MATNAIGKGTKTIGINMSATMADDLEARASSMHLSTSKYCKVILNGIRPTSGMRVVMKSRS